MDELIIDEKKYISSKQAAKVTGYAKDYVGQLCREGRVQAQLVGRSWYVLESAILDHRFGTETVAREAEEQATSVEPVFGWRAPRYEAAQDEPLPVVEKVTDEAPAGDVAVEVPIAHSQEEALEESQDAPEAISPAFDMVPAPTNKSAAPVESEAEYEPVTGGSDVDVALVENGNETEQVEEATPTPAPVNRRLRRHRMKRLVYGALRAVLIAAAIVSTAFTAANSGIFDDKLASLNRVHTLLGISIYKK